MVEIATRQHGRITTSQLLAAGLTEDHVRGHVRRGLLRREHRGVYVVGHLAVVPLGRAAGALLAAGPRATISHWSAAHVTNLGDFPLVAAVDVTVPAERRLQRPGLRVHRSDLGAGEVMRKEGLAVTTPARTIADLAAAGATPAILERLLAEAHGRGAKVEVVEGRKGAGALRRALEGGVRITRSEAERRFLRLIRDAGLPLPETNVAMGDWEIDALWRTERVAVEIDSWSCEEPLAVAADVAATLARAA